MVSSPKKKDQAKKKTTTLASTSKTKNTINELSCDEAMSESSNQGATTSGNSLKKKKSPNLPAIDKFFKFLRKGVTKKGKESHVYQCLIENCNNPVLEIILCNS